MTALPGSARRLSKRCANRFERERFDFLISNAGVGLRVSFAETTVEQFDMLMNVHFQGAVLPDAATAAAINDGGRIIHISSGLARFTIGRQRLCGDERRD